MSLADLAVGTAAQDDPRRRSGVHRIFDDQGPVDDDGCTRAPWIAMRICIGCLVPEIFWIKNRDVGAVARLQ
jgi:hypothetical protein